MESPGGPDAGLEQALAVAFAFLGRRERTVCEVREHLLGREHDPESVRAAIDQLIEDGYLDDARYARLFAQDKRALEQWGGERIRRSLLERGIDRELADQAAADQAVVEQSELDRARALLRTRFPDGASDNRTRRRALGVLLRKGYEYDLACDALDALGHA